MKMFLRIGPAMGPPNGVEARMGVFVAQNSAAARLLCNQSPQSSNLGAPEGTSLVLVGQPAAAPKRSAIKLVEQLCAEPKSSPIPLWGSSV